MSRFRTGTRPHRHSAFVGQRRAGTLRFTQHIVVDSGKALSLMSTLATGFIKKRTASGRDISGAPFQPYSATYAEALREGGESTKVDLTLTGGMLASIAETGRNVTARGGSVSIGPGTGTSPRVSLVGGRAVRTGGRGPAHNIVGSYLHFGTPKMPARKFLGLTLRETKKVKRALEQQQARILRERRGPPR